MGDLSENAEYHDAKDQQGLMEARIYEIAEILKKAIIDDSAAGRDIISLGSSFVVEDPAGKRRELTVVGFNEADPLSGRISNESPMGMAFYGHKVGDTVEIDAPRGVVAYKVIEIK